MKIPTTQLATEIVMSAVPEYVKDDAYAVEPKLDGHRIMLLGTGDGVRALGRSGDPYGSKVPKAFKRFILPEGWAMDGELVDGVMWAFDMIPPGRADLPLTTRREMVALVVHQLDSPALRLVPQATGEQAKAEMILRIIESNREGFILKRLDAPYAAGRSMNWLKVKLVSTIDVVILDVGRNGKDAADLGVYSKGKMTNVGRVSTVGKPVNVGDVVELRYLYATNRDRPRLVQPRILRIRDDKAPEECTLDQVKYTEKSALTH